LDGVDKAVQLIEIGLSIEGVINGKHRILPVFYSARELIVNSAGQTISSFNPNILDLSERLEYERFLSMIIQHLCKKTGMAFGEAREHVEQAFDSFINKFIPDCEKRHSVEYKMRNIIKFFVPVFILRLRRKLLAKLRGKPFTNQYCRKQIEKTKHIPGFPFYDENAKKEWDIIRSFVLKHNIRKTYSI
jgi:hypothetical protein